MAEAMERWSDELLDGMRRVGDPPSDVLVEQVLDEDGPDALRKLNRFLQTWRAPVDERVPAGIRAFLEEPVVYPDWVDERQLARGQELFREHAPETLLILFLKSLPQYFANADGDQSFSRADIFDPKMVHRLILEVTQLLLDVALLGNLRVRPRKSLGVYALQKLRLHHSVVRLWVLPDPRLPSRRDLPPWRPEWGAPINQEDIAGAVAAFAVWDLEGLDQVGLELPAADREATLMYWRVIAWLLGMDDCLQPRDLEDAAELLAAVDRRQFRRSPQGITLTRQLLAIPQGFLPRWLDGVPTWLMRRLMTPRFVQMLEVPRVPVLCNLVLSLPYLLLGRARVKRQVTSRLGERFLRWSRQAGDRHGDRGEFRMPPEVAARVLGTAPASAAAPPSPPGGGS